MTDTLVTTPELDRLAERVERAATLVGDLRIRGAKLEQENAQLMAAQQQSAAQVQQLQLQLKELQARLQGQDPGAILGELAALKKEQRDWQTERRDVAARIEAISTKLERLE